MTSPDLTLALWNFNLTTTRSPSPQVQPSVGTVLAVRLAGRRTRQSFDETAFATMAEGVDKLLRAGLTEEDARQAAVDAVVQATDDRAPGVAADLIRRAPRMLRQRRRRSKRFQRVLRVYWGRPFDLYLSICVAAEEAGRRFDDRLATEAEERQDYQFEALTGLYARASRTAMEIHHALAGGFPMAALARCRTLHEIAVIMMVLSEFGETEEHADLAERFLLHDAVQSWKDAKTYQKHCAALGGDPLGVDEMSELEQARQVLLTRFGPEYRHDYGWAAGLAGLKQLTFIKLEELAKVAHLRGHYSWASHEIHADSKGWRLNVFEQGDVLYKQTGAMHFGMAEPASWALLSLQQCMGTLLFSTDDVSPMEMLGFKALQHLIDEAVETFDRAEERVEESDKRVLKWPPWKRRLWILWKSITHQPK
ncbi:MAG: DUF5677 domain-containing protein [Actinobacteria bacterium]|nr:DUF5677 domain-containing protein [Actinomycetota bacterium]